MENYILETVSVLVRGCIGVFFLTDQRTNRPTDQRFFYCSFIIGTNLTGTILFSDSPEESLVIRSNSW